MAISEEVDVDAVDAVMQVMDAVGRVLVGETMWMSVCDEAVLVVATSVVMPGRWRGCWVMRLGWEAERLNCPGPAEFLGEGDGLGREKSAATASDMMDCVCMGVVAIFD